jgi:hypothetical protein
LYFRSFVLADHRLRDKKVVGVFDAFFVLLSVTSNKPSHTTLQVETSPLPSTLRRITDTLSQNCPEGVYPGGLFKLTC